LEQPKTSETNVIEEKQKNPTVDTSSNESLIDIIVYHLYNLIYDEVLIVASQTQITREQYESFNNDTYGQS